jgi:hypothetical protein
LWKTVKMVKSILVTEFSVGPWGSSDENCAQKCWRSVAIVKRILEGLHCIGLGALWDHQMKTALIGLILDCCAERAGETRDYIHQQLSNLPGNFSRWKGEPQRWPLGEGGTLSHQPPWTIFCCSPKSPHWRPLGIQELRQ